MKRRRRDCDLFEQWAEIGAGDSSDRCLAYLIGGKMAKIQVFRPHNTRRCVMLWPGDTAAL